MPNQVPQDIVLSDRLNATPQLSGSLFHQHWTPRGHTFGTCMSRPEINWMYINIPKNASSWTKPNLLDHGFEFYNYHQDNLYHKHAVIVLRDPLERWLSGVCEFFALYHPNLDLNDARRPFYELVLDLVTLDDHTEKQIYFIADLNPHKSTFMYCDENYRLYFSQWLRNQGIDNRYDNYEYQHTTESSDIRKLFKSYFKQFLNNEKYIQHIKNHYRLDYELINSVKFWKG